MPKKSFTIEVEVDESKLTQTEKAHLKKVIEDAVKDRDKYPPNTSLYFKIA